MLRQDSRLGVLLQALVGFPLTALLPEEGPWRRLPSAVSSVPVWAPPPLPGDAGTFNSKAQFGRVLDCVSMSAELELPFRPDNQLTEVMRLRVQSLHQRGQKKQDGERLLQPNEAVYRLDFPTQLLRFSHWGVRLAGSGRLTITATSQLWTPDLTHLMSRQLLEPAGTFWRGQGAAGSTAVQCYEAEAQEFGERIAELAKVRKVMYFLFAFEDGCSPETVDSCISFTAES